MWFKFKSKFYYFPDRKSLVIFYRWVHTAVYIDCGFVDVNSKLSSNTKIRSIT